MLIGVVIPTVPGRERELARALDSHSDYELGRPSLVRLEVLRGFSTCGEAWNAGAAELLERFGENLTHLCFSADDLIARPGWYGAALASLEQGYLPAPELYLESGELDPKTSHDGPPGSLVAFSRVPFFPAAAWRFIGPMPALHYYSDCWVGDRLSELGYRTRVAAGFAFTHLWAQPGRIHTDDPDRALYEREAAAHPYRNLEARNR